MIDLRCGDCREILREIPEGSIDAVITDPPYPEIDRPYGRWTEDEWHGLMRDVVPQCRRVLKPHGSAVFILQPNCSRMGSMRLWAWEFQLWAAREWNLVQDSYWFNNTALPKCGQVRSRALPRPSVKLCVWLGAPDCYRDIDAVLKSPAALRRRDISMTPSGWRGTSKPRFHRRRKMNDSVVRRGGSTPFNLLTVSSSKSSRPGHGAGTPARVCDWWIRFLTRPGDTVLDPFVGMGTVAERAEGLGRHAIGIDRRPEYIESTRRRLDSARAGQPPAAGAAQ